ncbi:transcription termination factor MTEF18, mitochondrial-like [Bidens hawaiensis]|uniref:transcription termination factor MTEF18, mitochondrial-like n=1 Tax=Bidens hawaiensis TaxID=980011 RepID=UPI004049E0AF
MLRISTFLRSHNRHCSTVHGDRTVDYLINSLNFSKQDAISLSEGNLTNLTSTINSDCILTTFKNYGLTLTQIKQIVSSVPKILNCKAHKTLQPKLRVFHELGLSGSDLVVLIRRNPEVFGFGLQTRIIPGINLLKMYLGSDENVVTFINKSRWLYFTNYSMKRLSTNVTLLQNLGLSNERIVKFMLSNPESFMVNPKLFENRVNYVEEKLGISRGLRGFIHGVSVALYVTDAEVEKKMNLFRSFGWSDSDIGLLVKAQPYCLNKSEDNIHEKLEFLMTGLGYKPDYLIRCSTFFTFSLNKRVIPRNNMLKILKDKKLVKGKLMLITVVSYSELRFLKFLRGFEGDVPGLCEMYMDSVRRVS